MVTGVQYLIAPISIFALIINVLMFLLLEGSFMNDYDIVNLFIGYLEFYRSLSQRNIVFHSLNFKGNGHGNEIATQIWFIH